MIDLRDAKIIAVEQIEARYPKDPPFHPSRAYPEYQGIIGAEENPVYEGVRQLFIDLGLDEENIDTPQWNPLGELIRPNQQVLLKPNIVLHKNYAGHSIDAVITHGSVIRAVADYALKALQGTGRLIIGDAPIQECKFERANQVSGLNRVVEFYKEQNLPVELHDFRLVTSEDSLTGTRTRLAGDPSGYSYVNLSVKSEHQAANDYSKFRVTNYDPLFMQNHHNHNKHEYIVANSVLKSDVIISIPKLKTHRKAGISISMKNLVGINGHKDCLPHHKKSSKEEGGDEYLFKSKLKEWATLLAEFEDTQKSELIRFFTKIPSRLIYEIAKLISTDEYFEGSWWGNDTIWRTVIDLNKLLFYWNLERNELDTKQQISFMTIVDGVISGEGEGPIKPTPKPIGLLIGGFNPVATDIVGARLMGFDWKKIPLLVNGIDRLANFPAEAITVISSREQLRGKIVDNSLEKFFEFNSPQGWKGYIEL
jgi:uncharacterized protein (DUF362 family)